MGLCLLQMLIGIRILGWGFGGLILQNWEARRPLFQGPRTYLDTANLISGDE